MRGGELQQLGVPCSQTPFDGAKMAFGLL
jgi:hypothetical protein